MDLKQWAWLVVGAAAAAFVCVILMAALGKGVPKGLVIRLELADDDDAGQFTSLSEALKKKISQGIFADYGFLVSYSLLNAALFFFVRELHPRGSWPWHPTFVAVGVVLAVFMLVGDAVENWQILSLLKTPSDTALLTLATRIKWVALGVSSLLLGAAFLSAHRNPHLWLGLLQLTAYWIAAYLCFQGVVNRDAAALQRSFVAFAAAWLPSAFHAGLTLRGGA